MDDAIQSDPREEIIETVSSEMNRIRRRMDEIRDQIEQMQAAVDKEQSKYSGIATEIRNVKDNLDTIPREDIRDKYDEALDVRFRLATMRGQLEKFEGNYGELEKQQELLGQILASVQGVEMLPSDGSVGGETSSRAGLDVVGIIRAQEDERYRLSRQMHDGPAQSLTNFILQAEICQRLFDRNPDRAAEELDSLKTNASRTFQKVREFIFDLRPMMLDDLGVAPTVRRYVESFSEKNDVEIKLEIVNDDRRLENHREVMIFRGIQDLMAAARDYGAPAEMNIRLDMGTDPIRILVQDDGRGFDSDAIDLVNNDDDYHGDGDARISLLSTLNSKFELVGGDVTVQSNETDGTTVRIEMPAGDF